MIEHEFVKDLLELGREPMRELEVCQPSEREARRQAHIANAVPLYTAGKPLPTTRQLVREQPWHRQAAYAIAWGKGTKELCEAFECSPSAISTLRQQPFFRAMVAQIMADMQTSEQMGALEILEAAAKGAATSIKDLSTSATSEAVRLAANKEILDRVWGKAPQVVEKRNPLPTDPVQAYKALQDKLARLKEEQSKILPVLPSQIEEPTKPS